MNATLPESLSSLMTPVVVGQVSTALDEPPDAVSRAISAVFPVLLRGLELGVRQPRCLNTLFALATHKSNDGRQLSNVGDVFAGQSQTALALGNGMLHALFGNHIDTVARPIAVHAGIEPRSADTLLTAAAQLVMADIGQRLRVARQQTPAALSSLVLREASTAVATGAGRTWITSDALLPGRSRTSSDALLTGRSGAGSDALLTGRSGAGSDALLPGRSDAAAAWNTAAVNTERTRVPGPRLGEVVRRVTNPITSRQTEDARGRPGLSGIGLSGTAGANVARETPRKSIWSWIWLPIVGGLVAAFLLLNSPDIRAWLWPAIQQSNVPRTSTVGPNIGGANTGGTRLDSGRAPTNVTPSVAAAPRGGRLSLDVREDSVEAGLIRYIESSRPLISTDWFELDRITFQTASNALTTASTIQVLNIAAILNAYPSVRLKIGGYTDNVGDPAGNLRLSDARANTVMRELVSLGIAPERVTAEGYGEQHPVADNSTPEGRARNRRIAFRVTQR